MQDFYFYLNKGSEYFLDRWDVCCFTFMLLSVFKCV